MACHKLDIVDQQWASHQEDTLSNVVASCTCRIVRRD